MLQQHKLSYSSSCSSMLRWSATTISRRTKGSGFWDLKKIFASHLVVSPEELYTTNLFDEPVKPECNNTNHHPPSSNILLLQTIWYTSHVDKLGNRHFLCDKNVVASGGRNKIYCNPCVLRIHSLICCEAKLTDWLRSLLNNNNNDMHCVVSPPLAGPSSIWKRLNNCILFLVLFLIIIS